MLTKFKSIHFISKINKMKKITFLRNGLLTLVALFLLVGTQAKAQQKEILDSDGTIMFTMTERPSDSALMKMDIFEFCKTLGIPSEYNKRCSEIILPLCEAGKIIIPANTNPYYGQVSSVDEGDCYWYIGTGYQNGILKRNILANKNLITNGKLTPENAKKWKIVK